MASVESVCRDRTKIDASRLGAQVRAIVNRQPAVGLAVGVVTGEGLEFFHGHGVTDMRSKESITEDTVFRIASITKTVTGIAVMQLWERGRIDLDAPASDYLRSYELVPADADFRPATVRHLLTHTAGLPELASAQGLVRPDFGESVEPEAHHPTLAEFYRGVLRIGCDPGSRFVYNNHGPATLGQIVEDTTGQALAEYLREHVFVPLGMVETDLLRTDRLEARRATGYEIGSRGVREVAERDMITAGAASIFSTPADMARYLTALLRGGGNENGTILEPATMAMMFEAHYRPDPRIPGMGLAFFRSDVSGHSVVGHQGSHPGFHSQISLVPDAGLAVMAFTNGARQADLWLPGEVNGLLENLLGTTPDGRRFPHRPDIWDDICGWYRLSAALSDIRLRSMMGAGVEVFVRRGRLMMRFLTPIPELAQGFTLQSDDAHDPYIYRIDISDSGRDHIRVVFGQDSPGMTTRLHLDVMPLTLEKQPASTNPRNWFVNGLAVGAAATALSRIRRRVSAEVP